MQFMLPGQPTQPPTWGGLMQLMKPEDPDCCDRTAAIWFKVDPATLQVADNEPDF
jgi:hypothetical protein